MVISFSQVQSPESIANENSVKLEREKVLCKTGNLAKGDYVNKRRSKRTKGERMFSKVVEVCGGKMKQEVSLCWLEGQSFDWLIIIERSSLPYMIWTKC